MAKALVSAMKDIHGIWRYGNQERLLGDGDIYDDQPCKEPTEEHFRQQEQEVQSLCG